MENKEKTMSLDELMRSMFNKEELEEMEKQFQQMAEAYASGSTTNE